MCELKKIWRFYIFVLSLQRKKRQTYYHYQDILRGGAVVARWAHNPKVVGSSPAPATRKILSINIEGIFLWYSTFDPTWIHWLTGKTLCLGT